ncbi:glycosyltransferase family 25 protein [Xenorhabdus bovienii]|uniref:glycosyltransferase family 25 protein n=1 Tax=Xenorhabdus bovienii TaxID=40576 RepID=UPI0023B2AC83|nr:glycosyltransferase family 25 protein [Xenorhabdus bovienii]MDE9453839.1 glycosyltransferase family 25 protein [Xenorhabdus bovienii]
MVNTNDFLKNKIDVCIISLEHHTERRENLINSLKNNNIIPRVSYAVNGKKLSAEEYFLNFKAKSSKLFGRKFLTPSELGCFLSHRKAIGEFLDKNNQWLLILEDDVFVNTDLTQLINKIDKLNDDSVYILGGQDGLKSFQKVILKNNILNIRKVMFGTHRWIYRTCCYLISKNTASHLYNFMNNTTYIADDWSLILKNTKIKNIYYFPCFSHPINLENSIIEEERLFIK